MSSSTDNNEGDKVKKFLFDTNNFDKVKTPEAELAVYTESQMLTLRQQSQALGRDEGLDEARQRQEEQMATALDRLVDAAGALAAREEERDIQRMTDATRLALQVAHKLLPQFAQKYAIAEIERVILQSLDSRKDEPRVAVIVAPMHMEAVKSRIDALALEKGFAGKMIIVADERMAPTDCRVEWADGGTERLYERLYAQIEEEFTKAIAGMQAAVEDIENNG